MSRASVLLCLLACLSTTISEEDKHLKELTEHFEHLKYIAQFKCHAPQPRVLSVHKLFSEEKLRGKVFFPEVTVLHRCDDYTGSCVSEHHCRAAHSDTVQLLFKVTFLQDMDGHKRGTWAMEHHAMKNHTQCACVAPPPLEPVITDMFCSNLRTSCSALVSTCSQLHTSCGALSLAQKHREREKTVVEIPHVVVNETTTESSED